MSDSIPAVAILKSALKDGYILDIIVKGKDKRAYDGGLNNREIIHIAADGIIYKTEADEEVVYVPMSRIDHISVTKSYDFENAFDFSTVKKDGIF